MTTGPPPICVACVRFAPSGENGIGPACQAFPDHIPAPIWRDGFDHRNAYRGDHGIRFLMKAGGDEALDAYEQGLSSG